MSRKENILSRIIAEIGNEIKYQEFSKANVSITPGTYEEVIVPVNIPSGYEIMTTGRFRVSGTGATSIYWSQIFWDSSGVHCVLRNTASSTTSNVQVIIGVIFKKKH